MPQSSPLRPGTPQEVDAALEDLSHRLMDFSDQVERHPTRSEETVAVAAILKRCSREVGRLRYAVPSRADLAAWCMRNLFELWVIFSTMSGSIE